MAESTGNNRITQKVTIKDGVVMYYINDEFVQKMTTDDLNLFYIGLRVCGEQIIAYDHLMIRTYE